MSVLKCKMCGGTIEYVPGTTVGECQHCGSKQTLPKTGDEVLANLFNRANNMRLKCEFDKATSLYEKIVEQDDSEAEAHWGIVLCRYGIEYVEDPTTKKRIPTCHRTLYDAVTKDPDYQAAIDYSDTLQQTIYEKEAKEIDKIQKRILAIVQNEEHFDVFICYKETDEDGNRTKDSVIANDIYHQLTLEGYKVFYAAITLEDKLGQEYEPYIFAALKTAKVMLVIGSKPKFFNSVWVKNEWSRFLNLMKTDRSKILIPCYKDMDAYDLPEEFSHLQAQDMSKLGFMLDLNRVIKKITNTNEQKVTAKEVFVTNRDTNVEPLLKRAFMYLEDGEWDKADEYCEKVLDQDPENGEAYIGKLMVELKVRHQDNLGDQQTPFYTNNYYKKAIRYSSLDTVNTLEGYNNKIIERNENERLLGIYNKAIALMNNARIENEYVVAADLFDSLNGFKDSREKVQICHEKAKECREEAEINRKNTVYESAKACMESNSVLEVEHAIECFQEIRGWKDTDEQIDLCKKKIEELKKEEEEYYKECARKEQKERIRKKKENKKIAIASIIIIVFVLFFILLVSEIIPNSKYNKALDMYNNGQYDEAIEILTDLNYKDSEAILKDVKGVRAVELILDGKLELGNKYLTEVYNNDQLIGKKTEIAKLALERKNYDTVITLLTGIENGYSKGILDEAKFYKAEELIELGEFADALGLLTDNSFEGSKELQKRASLSRIKVFIDAGEYDVALIFLEDIEIDGSEELRAEAELGIVNEIIASGDLISAYNQLQEIDNDLAKDRIEEVRNMILLQVDELIIQGKGLETYKILEETLSKEELAEICDSIIKSANIGDTILFGSYEQDGKIENGNEAIEWIVLDKENNELYLISKYALDSKPYNTKGTDASWGKCSLRKWLNEEFIEMAFTEIEQTRIIKQHGDMEDGIYLIKKEEFNNLKEIQLCVPTEYAIREGVKTYDGYCRWWVIGDFRSEWDQHYGNMLMVTMINEERQIKEFDPKSVNIGVRPVCRIQKNT